MSHPTFNLGQFLEKEKLKTNGSNFTDWQRNLRILIGPAKMSYVLDAVIGDAPAADASQDEKNVHQSKLDDESIVRSGMLYAMEAELQKRYEKMSAHEMITDLTAVFAPHARVERYEASNLFFSAKMEEHSSMSEHVVKMSGYVQRLKTLECQIPDELAIDWVLQSLPPSYKQFVLNYNMHGMEKSLAELFAMLKSAEVEIKKEH
jgi:gag-polypeptide of LTR copia-type